MIDDSYSVNQVTHTTTSAGAFTVSGTGGTTTSSVATSLTGAPTAGSTSLSSTITGLGRHEAYIALSGGFGTLFAGAPNSASLTVAGMSSPLGTGIGSGYTINGASNTGWTSAAAQTRYSRSVKYVSPNFNGLTVALQYAPGNDVAGATNLTSVLQVPNNRNITDIGVTYSKGNLNVGWSNLQQKEQTNGLGFYAQTSIVGTSSSATGNAASTSVNQLAANYKFGNVTVYGAAFNGNGIAGTTTAINASGMRGAIKADIGNLTAIAQYTEITTNTGTTAGGFALNGNVTQKVTGARLDYSLSKTAAGYVGYELYDSGQSASNQQTLVSVGLRKSF